MRRVYKCPQFLLDLAEELTWLNEKAGAEVANAWYQSLKETIRPLEKHPRLGRPRKDLSPTGIRSWRLARFPRWLLFYGIDEKEHLVLHRVRQGSMNLLVLKMES
ncbi:MAG TPA: type II toxin-antitoxin system RelE/ParE family toxin [Verrucomicrobiae bacterium]|jgi:plasmid stabilization system protein ParE|nr:type II toxin-antitoxin system RelE/ParE family toxin [Verrucomicrobiae bacterium]